MYLTEVASELKTQIKNSGRSQESVARSLGYSRVALNRYLNGHLPMPALVLIGLCDELGFSVRFGTHDRTLNFEWRRENGKT